MPEIPDGWERVENEVLPGDLILIQWPEGVTGPNWRQSTATDTVETCYVIRKIPV